MVPAVAVQALDVTGAGDSFNAALAVGLAGGMDLRSAVRAGHPRRRLHGHPSGRDRRSADEGGVGGVFRLNDYGFIGMAAGTAGDRG